MRKIIPIAFLIAGLFFTCKSIYINAWKDKMQCCDAYTLTNIQFGKDSIYLGVSEDTISMMMVTLAQTNNRYKIDGPDYAFLYVLNEKNDTVARTVISGLPGPGKPRTYWAFGREVWKPKPDLNKLRVYIQDYCPDIKFKTNKNGNH